MWRWTVLLCYMCLLKQEKLCVWSVIIIIDSLSPYENYKEAEKRMYIYRSQIVQRIKEQEHDFSCGRTYQSLVIITSSSSLCLSLIPESIDGLPQDDGRLCSCSFMLSLLSISLKISESTQLTVLMGENSKAWSLGNFLHRTPRGGGLGGVLTAFNLRRVALRGESWAAFGSLCITATVELPVVSCLSISS